MIRIELQHIAPRLRRLRRTGEDLGAPGSHHRASIRFLPIADFDHEHAYVDAEHLAGKRQRTAPLAGAGFGGKAPDAGLPVVKRLRHRGIGFVRPSRRNALVLVIDPGGRPEHRFQTRGANEGGWAPEAVDLTHFLRDGNPALGGHLLFENSRRKNGAHLRRGRRLPIRPKRW